MDKNLPMTTEEALSKAWPMFCAPLLQVQQLQLHALLAWQQGAAAAMQELYDQWACHFAGGVPIDA